MLKNRSKTLLIATLLSTIYSLYLIIHFYGTTASAEGAEAVGSAIATALVTPHIAMFLIGAVFGWLGLFLKAGWAALVAAILYTVGVFLFFLYIMFALPIMILGFVGFNCQKKINKSASAE